MHESIADVASPSEEDGRVDVTLIVPCYLAETLIAPALESISRQSMNRRDFEVIFVLNGPPDGTPSIIENRLRSERDLQYRIVSAEIASLSNARNLGIGLARGIYATWVDVDDWLSDDFLQLLADSAEDGIVPVAQVVDVDELTQTEQGSPITEQLLANPAGVYSAAVLSRAMGFAACKLIRVDLARQRAFDTNLRSGEDVAFFGPFMAENRLRFDNTPAHRGATYYRLIRSGSMSRQEPDFDFSVTQRIRVMKHLQEAIDQNPNGPLTTSFESMIRSQALFSKRLLVREPDARDRVIEAYQHSGVRRIPWDYFSTPTSNLIISYNFPPFADASAIVAAKRALVAGDQWNVISNAMWNARKTDPDLKQITGPFVSIHKIIKQPAVFGAWDGIVQFCEHGLVALKEIESVAGPQTRLYSRSMWPASHFLAALCKSRSQYAPTWDAEFSDPLRRDVGGLDRRGAVGTGALRDEFEQIITDAGYSIPNLDSLFAWAEYLPYILADRLIFTNANQLAYMVSYIEDSRLRELVYRKAVVAPQPTLPPRYYEMGDPKGIALPRDRVHIGYFGTFYANRGLGTLLDELAQADETVRSRIGLHVFTGQRAQLESDVMVRQLDDCVFAHDNIPYLDFLTATRRFDVLLANDADSWSAGHRANPYLPSKISDYIGSGRPIWAIFEPGSPLARVPVHYRGRLNDAAAIRQVLAAIAKREKS